LKTRKYVGTLVHSVSHAIDDHGAEGKADRELLFSGITTDGELLVEEAIFTINPFTHKEWTLK
jgi:hypothetical protein